MWCVSDGNSLWAANYQQCGPVFCPANYLWLHSPGRPPLYVRVNPGLRIQDNVWDNVQGNRQFLGRKTVNIKYNWQSCCVERRWREVFALFLCWQLSVIELCQLCYQVTLDTRHQPGSTRPPPGRKYDIMYNLEISAFSRYCMIIKYFTHSKSFWLLPTEI